MCHYRDGACSRAELVLLLAAALPLSVIIGMTSVTHANILP